MRSDTRNLLIVKNQKKELLPLSEQDSLRIVAIMKSNDKDMKDEMLSLYRKSLAYEVDSIKINPENQVLEIADKFFNNRERLKKQATEHKDNRIILDGTIYQITVTDSKGVAYVSYAHSPSKESHPEIYELISSLGNTYTAHQIKK